jgi:hypothetical protein
MSPASEDPRVISAREYLRHLGPGPQPAELPRGALNREAAELRELLRGVLDYVTAAVSLTDEQLATLGHALGDAIAWATADDLCHVCEQSPSGICPAHQAELDQRDTYINLARELGIELPPDGIA